MQAFLEIVRQSFRTLWAHKLRSFLTMFGIAWGVGSLLLLVGLGEGFRSGQRKQMANIGQDIMFTFPALAPTAPGSMLGARQWWITWDDYLAVKDEAKSLRYLSPVIARGDVRASSEFTSAAGEVTGIVPEYNQIRHIPLKSGRWFNDADVEQSRRVIVIGHEMERNMFPGQPAIGAHVLLNGARFQVIGVLEKVGREGNNGTNMRTFAPVSVMREIFPVKGAQVDNAISYLNYRPLHPDLHERAKAEVQTILARRHNFDPKNDDAFGHWDTIAGARKVATIFDGMNMFLGAVGVVTLALGAIGIINIMLVSVSERTREIGLRKALGATHRNILTQFFVEGVFLTFVSGGVGLLLTFLLVTALAQLPAPEGFDTPRIVPLSAAIAILSLGTAGIAAGLYPARKAAMLQPVEALRQE